MTICPTCGIKFVPTTANPIYCAPACWPQVQAERAAARQAAARQAARPTPAAKPKRRTRSAKRNALVRRVLGYRQLFNAVAALDEPLSVGAVAVWCWLWTCERKGRAKFTTRKLAQRFGVDQSTATRWTGELARVGLIEMVRRGKPGRSATIVRVRYSPDTKPDGQP